MKPDDISNLAVKCYRHFLSDRRSAVLAIWHWDKNYDTWNVCRVINLAIIFKDFLNFVLFHRSVSFIWLELPGPIVGPEKTNENRASACRIRESSIQKKTLRFSENCFSTFYRCMKVSNVNLITVLYNSRTDEWMDVVQWINRVPLKHISLNLECLLSHKFYNLLVTLTIQPPTFLRRKLHRYVQTLRM